MQRCKTIVAYCDYSIHKRICRNTCDKARLCKQQIKQTSDKVADSNFVVQPPAVFTALHFKFTPTRALKPRCTAKFVPSGVAHFTGVLQKKAILHPLQKHFKIQVSEMLNNKKPSLMTIR
jgi:hypothetical protein